MDIRRHRHIRSFIYFESYFKFSLDIALQSNLSIKLVLSLCAFWRLKTNVVRFLFLPFLNLIFFTCENLLLKILDVQKNLVNFFATSYFLHDKDTAVIFYNINLGTLTHDLIWLEVDRPQCVTMFPRQSRKKLK